MAQARRLWLGPRAAAADDSLLHTTWLSAAIATGTATVLMGAALYRVTGAAISVDGPLYVGFAATWIAVAVVGARRLPPRG